MFTRALTQFPIELTDHILRDLARIVLPDNPVSAVQLQLISRSTRKLLLPIIYFTFVVLVPSDDHFNWDGVEPTSTPTMDFLRALSLDPDAIPRNFIRHLVFNSTGSIQVPSRPLYGTWRVQSISANFHRGLDRLQTWIQPDVLNITGPEMISSSPEDLPWMLSTIDSFSLVSPATFVLGELSDGVIDAGLGFFLKSRDSLRIGLPAFEIKPRTLQITVFWPDLLMISESVRVGRLSRRILEVLNIPHLRLVLVCSRDDPISQTLSGRLIDILRAAKDESADNAEERWSRLEVRWVVPRPSVLWDVGFWVEEVTVHGTDRQLL